MDGMFCFQCEQAASGRGCTKNGVCGKTSVTAGLQDRIIGELCAYAAACGAESSPETDALVETALFSTLTNVSFDDRSLRELVGRVRALGDAAGAGEGYDMSRVWDAPEDIRSLKSLLLFGMKGIAAYASHARVLGRTSGEVSSFLLKGLALLGSDAGADALLAAVMEAGKANLACMEMLSDANRGAFGIPAPVSVSRTVEKGPFIVITGHDLQDLHDLLEQTEGRGVAVYTHGEMLPAHAYPGLRRYAHFKGHFGTAWQNQQKEFDGLPAPVLFTTNCLMPVKDSYADRVFTTGAVRYPGMTHIADHDFSPVIEKALQLGGYAEDRSFPGMNGGLSVTTGFGSEAILSSAGAIVEAVRSGAIRHFLLVGGCDGARPGRSYFTDFVKQAPADTVVLTLACGKFRFNDLELGTIGGIPRLLDMGQCNDAYGAVKVALALAEAFGCGVNDLPLTLVLSWYEQKAVAILLTLLYLGIRDIRLGPTLPAFVSPAVLDFLVKNFGVRPVTAPEDDLAEILRNG